MRHWISQNSQVNQNQSNYGWVDQIQGRYSQVAGADNQHWQQSLALSSCIFLAGLKKTKQTQAVKQVCGSVTNSAAQIRIASCWGITWYPRRQSPGVWLRGMGIIISVCYLSWSGMGAEAGCVQASAYTTSQKVRQDDSPQQCVVSSSFQGSQRMWYTSYRCHVCLKLRVPAYLSKRDKYRNLQISIESPDNEFGNEFCCNEAASRIAKFRGTCQWPSWGEFTQKRIGAVPSFKFSMQSKSLQKLSADALKLLYGSEVIQMSSTEG